MNEFRGGRVNSRQNATFRARSLSGITNDQTISLYDAVNYPTDDELTFGNFWARYERTGIGRGIIDKFVNDTWQEIPDVRDTEGSEFEQHVDSFFERRGLRGSPKQWFINAHKMAMLGEYSLIFLGVDDGKELTEPIDGVGEDTTAFDGPESLNFLAVYDQDRIDDLILEEDLTNERYGLPLTYDIQVTDDDVETVHWSRIIHIPQNVVDDPLRGTPFLKPITHELMNIDKILAASGEGYWRGAYQGFVMKPPKGPDGNRIDTSAMENRSDLEAQIDNYINNFQRTIATTGEVETLSSQISNPEPQMMTQFRSISAYLDAPMSIIMGNETGERATSEDKNMWHERVSGIRNVFVEDTMIRPLFDRFIDIGIFAEPQSEAYELVWEPLAEPSEQEMAETAHLWAQAIDLLSGGMPDTISTVEERRELLNWDPEMDIESADPMDESDPDTIAAVNALGYND